MTVNINKLYSTLEFQKDEMTKPVKKYNMNAKCIHSSMKLLPNYIKAFYFHALSVTLRQSQN